MSAPHNMWATASARRNGSGLTLTDTDVKSGQTYYYVARAMISGGKESIDSNEAAATIP